MEILIVIGAAIYMVAAIIVAEAGSERECGHLKALLLAIFLSPVFGMLYVLSSKRKPGEIRVNLDADFNRERVFSLTNEAIEEFKKESRAKEEERNGLIYGKFEPGKVDSIQASGNAKTKTEK